MTDSPPALEIDFRVRKSNALFIALALLLYLPGMRYVAALFVFHYLDWGWTGGKYSPFSKISNGLLNLNPGGREPRPAAPFVQRDRICFGISCGLMVAPFVEQPQWPFTLLAYALLVLVAWDFFGKASLSSPTEE